MFLDMWMPPVIVQAAEAVPPGASGLSPVATVPIHSPEGIAVALCTLRVDARALDRLLRAVPVEERAARGLVLIGQGRVKAWLSSEYLVGMGQALRRRRIEGWLREAWPVTGEDLLARPESVAYLEAASVEINPRDVHERIVEPGAALWFRSPGRGWRRFADAHLARAWARGEVASPDQDPTYHAALLQALDRFLRARASLTPRPGSGRARRGSR